MPVSNIGSVIRDQVNTMDGSHDINNHEIELEMFQKQVSEQFNDLSSIRGEELLSLSWVHNLLDVLILCQDDFRIILSNNNGYLSKPPMERLIREFHESDVKALDVCNAVRDGIEQVRQWEKSLEIVICALDAEKSLGQAQIRRAKKALNELLSGMLDEKELNSGLPHRNRSFGRSNGSSKDLKNLGLKSNGSSKDLKNLGHCRSLSWSVSRSWSASRQIQAMEYNLNAPRANEVTATNGLAVAVYTMSSVLLLVMWVLVAAIPCQDRGLQTHFSIPRQYIWASSIMSIHDRILDESKKKERKNSSGLLKELFQTEKCTRQMNQLLGSLQFPLSEKKALEIRENVEELKQVFKTFKDGLYPLERHVREVFHRIVRSRTEGLDSLARFCSG